MQISKRRQAYQQSTWFLLCCPRRLRERDKGTNEIVREREKKKETLLFRIPGMEETNWQRSNL
jgi:hypothetical protein